jgi:multiple sugar transport system substrate-binding protein
MLARSTPWSSLVLIALALAAAGCPQPGPTSQPSAAGPQQPAPLKLLVVEDEPLGKAIAREWISRTEGQIDVQQLGRAEVLAASRLPGDVVIAAGGDLGQLAEQGLIAPLAEETLAGDEFNRREIFDQVRLRDITWGNRTLAVPLGSPQLLLVYRKDLFDKLSLAAPRTWAEYQQAIERLKAEEASIAATVEPLADGWAGPLLLARAAAYVTHRDQVSPLFHLTTLDPLITARPYVRALEELVAAHKEQPSAERRNPAQVFDELLAGRAAMGVTWPAPAPQAAVAGKYPLAFALLPGATEVYDFARDEWEPRESTEEVHVPLLGVAGRVAAVTTTAGNPAAAENFVVWLGSREASAIVAPASAATTLFRDSQVSAAGRWTPALDAPATKQYAERLKQSASLQRYLSLRLPGRHEYLAALDAAVAQTLAGEKSPAEALAAAAVEWQKITAKRGLETQRRALQRDLGLESLP